VSDEDRQAENTDRELWRERPGDYYSDRIFVTRSGSIGIDCGGYVIMLPVRKWFELGKSYVSEKA
jgi:hypothetical protein